MAKKKQETAAEPQAAAAAPPAPETPPPAPDAPVAEKKAEAPAEGGGKKKRPGKAPPRGKKLRNQIKNYVTKIAKEGPAPLKRAVGLLKQMKRAKFDETVEVHMQLGVDASQSDQMIRGTVSLPHGIGKSVRVIVFCQGDNVAKATEAGADAAGGDDLIKKIQQENWTDFDIALATQDMMGKVSRLGKVLGPRGLMPSPKAGTIVSDVAAGVREFKAGKVEYRTDKGGNVHAGVGKLSFEEDKLVENITTFVEQVRAAKPAGVRGQYIRTVTVCSTMSPGVPVSV
jgi:large subunit ribosomal protein L1